jgi:Spy/CpxP family protein refolding chaperone
MLLSSLFKSGRTAATKFRHHRSEAFLTDLIGGVSMNLKPNWMIMALGVALVAMMVPGAALAGGPWHHGWGQCRMGYGPWGMGPGYGWSQGPWSNLTPEQREKLDNLRQQYWKETEPFRKDIFSKRQELWRLYAQEKPDQEAVRKLEKEVFELGQKLREKAFAFNQEAGDIAPEVREPYGPGWGWHHMGPDAGYMGPGWGCHRGRYPYMGGIGMGPGWGGQMMGPYAGGPCWGWGY